MDKVTNWYEKLPPHLKDETKLDKNFKTHMILPNSMILAIGGTGSGKTLALMEFINRKSEALSEIIIFTGSTQEEPLYKNFKEKNPEAVEIYTKIEDLPSLTDFDANDRHEKLIVFDDFINLPKKDMTKINQYLTAGRKYHFTVFLMAQNYKEVPKTVVRNVNYFILFKLNDNITIDSIIRNHNIGLIPKDRFKAMYVRATSQPRNFFMIDLKTTDPKLRYRHNFLNFM